jgi:hypothetical protein
MNQDMEAEVFVNKDICFRDAYKPRFPRLCMYMIYMVDAAGAKANPGFRREWAAHDGPSIV